LSAFFACENRENSRLEPSDVSATKQLKSDEGEKASQIIGVHCTGKKGKLIMDIFGFCGNHAP